ncbi:hypothetical protein [Parvularcula dongshanensis]|uniref:Uncharacterized protein YceH (UPF0502 family) n=1 Tax=Parvularcula dongshanensis TaxID=1173995 RepID=A0A840HYY6_9PROT|nr:hypothetical protein [Parvularcula dongshanensis]MBB4658056.1 uncharacterized protein YceH (UPF0502 family) [Parvularcula dongshanensis]
MSGPSRPTVLTPPGPGRLAAPERSEKPAPAGTAAMAARHVRALREDMLALTGTVESLVREVAALRQDVARLGAQAPTRAEPQAPAPSELAVRVGKVERRLAKLRRRVDWLS